jgi:glutathione S-transferase
VTLPQAAKANMLNAMTLHWSPRSPFVRKVMIAAHELGLSDRLECRRTVVSMAAPNKTLLPVNPLSKLPTLVLADGTMLYDSLVISEYLDSLAGGGRIVPLEGPRRWLELSRHAVANGLLDVLVLYRNEREKPEVARTQAWLSTFAVKLDATLAYFERDIGAIASHPFGIAQIALGVALSYLDFRFADLDWRAERPNLARWHVEFCARPSALATEVVDDG